MDSEYFDFRVEEELPEQPSGRLRPCPHCSKPIPADSLFCLYCGEPVYPARRKRWVIPVAIFVLVAFLLWILSRL